MSDRIGRITRLTTTPTYHSGKRDHGTGFDMMKRVEALEAENEALRARIAEKDEALGFIRGWTAKGDADGMTFSKQRLLIGIVDCHARKALEG